MEHVSISEAIRTLESLSQILDNAYWEASEMSSKDFIYDAITVIRDELNELAKLSVEDHNMPYEAITLGFRASLNKFETLQAKADYWVNRSKRVQQLKSELPALIALLPSKL